MVNIEKPTAIIFNDIPELLLGVGFTFSDSLDIFVTPPLKDDRYWVGVKISFKVVEMNTKKELYKLTTETLFTFNKEFTKIATVTDMAYDCYVLSVHRSNNIIKESKSQVLFGKQIKYNDEKLVREHIELAIRVNSVN